MQLILTVHYATTELFFRESNYLSAYNRYQFYAIRHQDYFNSMEWGPEVLQFYSDVDKWASMDDGPEKRRLYAKLVVDAFRLKARTIKFLRERLHTAGQLHYERYSLIK